MRSNLESFWTFGTRGQSRPGNRRMFRILSLALVVCSAVLTHQNQKEFPMTPEEMEMKNMHLDEDIAKTETEMDQLDTETLAEDNDDNRVAEFEMADSDVRILA